MNLKRPNGSEPEKTPVPRRPCGEHAIVAPVVELCSQGKLYEVEDWIAASRPIQFHQPKDRLMRRHRTALQVAVEKGFHSLAALLLVNGYDPNADCHEYLGLAIAARDYDLVDLLLRFGANPHAVDFCGVLETCDRRMMDRFLHAGVDPCAGDAVARALHFKGRPILGFVKQYRNDFSGLQRQVDIALHCFTVAEDLRGVALMLWLGGDPHAEVPATAESYPSQYCFGESAFESALWARNPGVLTPFLKRPIPRLQADKLLRAAPNRCRPEIVTRLLDAGANPNSTNENGDPVLSAYLTAPLWRLSRRTAEETEQMFQSVEILLAAGARWTPTTDQLRSFRRCLVDGESAVVIRLVDTLKRFAVLSPENLQELTRTPAVRKVLNGHTRPSRFETLPSPPAVVDVPTASSSIPVRRGYWKRHWSQR